LPEQFSDELLKRFLVGDVTAEERDRVEQAFIGNDELFEELTALEHEIFLAHSRGELEPPWRERLDAILLESPARRRRAEQVRAFSAALQDVKPVFAATSGSVRSGPTVARITTRTRSFLASAAAVVGLVGGAWLISRTTPGRAPAGLPSGDTPMPREVATFVLLPGATRSDARQANIFRMLPGAQQIRLQLTLEDQDVAAVRATLTPVGGEPVSVPDPPTVRKTGAAIEIDWLIPARLLAPGDYIVTVMAGGDAAEPLARRFFSLDER